MALFDKLGLPQYYTNQDLIAGLGGLNVNALGAESFYPVVFAERVNRCLMRGLIGETADGKTFGQRSVIIRHMIERTTGTGWKFLRNNQINDDIYTTSPTQDPIPLSESLTQSCDVIQGIEIAKALHESMAYYRDIEKDPNAPEVRRLRFALTGWAIRATNKGFIRAFTHEGAYTGFGTTALYNLSHAGRNPATCRGHYGSLAIAGAVGPALQYRHEVGNLGDVIAAAWQRIGGLCYNDIMEASMKASSLTDAPFSMAGIEYTNPYLGLTEDSPHYILIVSPRTAFQLSHDEAWTKNVSLPQSSLDIQGKANLLTGGLVYMGRINNVSVCQCQLMEGAEFVLQDAAQQPHRFAWSVLVGANAMGWTTGQHAYEEHKVHFRPLLYGCLRFWNGAKLLAFEGGANEKMNMPATERALKVEQGAFHIITRLS